MEGINIIFSLIGIVWTICCLVLFFKIWGMTNDVKTIKNILQTIPNKTATTNRPSSEDNSEESTVHFEEGDHVINIETGEELMVVQVFPDGDVTCKPVKGFGFRKVVRITNLKKI